MIAHTTIVAPTTLLSRLISACTVRARNPDVGRIVAKRRAGQATNLRSAPSRASCRTLVAIDLVAVRTGFGNVIGDVAHLFLVLRFRGEQRFSSCFSECLGESYKVWPPDGHRLSVRTQASGLQ